MPVTCYICGRDFGSRSIGIHLPNCQKKWDIEQEKLPKAQRRDVPAPPPDFDKVLSGEIKGKALAKVNQQAFEEYNDSALVPCPYCARTFLPKSLEAHHKLCTADRPMLKAEKGKTYTGQAKAKVNYPVLKSAKNKEKNTPNNTNAVAAATTSAIASSPASATTAAPASATAVKTAPIPEPPASAAVPVPVPVPVLMPAPAAVVEPHGLPPVCRRPPTPAGSRHQSPAAPVRTPPGGGGNPPPTPGRASPSPNGGGAPENRPPRHESPMSQSPEDSNSSDESVTSPTGDSSNRSSIVEETPVDCPTTRGQPGTLRKRETFIFPTGHQEETVTRERLVNLIEGTDLFNQEVHRRHLLHLILSYIREIRTRDIRALLDNPVFENPETSQEATEILQEFIKLKTNNNDE